MFRMVPGIDVGANDRWRRGALAGAVAGVIAVPAVSFLGRSVIRPMPREVPSGETAMAQRSVAVVAATYYAEVAIDRRDRMPLVSYDDAAVMHAQGLRGCHTSGPRY